MNHELPVVNAVTVEEVPVGSSNQQCDDVAIAIGTPVAKELPAANHVAYGVSMLHPQNSIHAIHRQQSNHENHTDTTKALSTCIAICISAPLVICQVVVAIMLLMKYSELAPKCKKLRNLVMYAGIFSLANNILSMASYALTKNQTPEEHHEKQSKYRNTTSTLGVVVFIYMCYGFHIFHMDGDMDFGSNAWGPGATNPERCGEDAFESLDIIFTVMFSVNMVILGLGCC